MMIRNFSTFASRTALLAALLPLAACGVDNQNRSVESVHQPVVSTTSFAYDLAAGSNGGLSDTEEARLAGWLASLDARYGDRISIATGGNTVSYALGQDISHLLGKRGLRLEAANADVASALPAGTVRLILRRASASVPGCPDWSKKQEGNIYGGTSSNYGCGVNSNLAAMIADPNDLVRGKTSDSDLEGATATRAIKSWQDKVPSGSGELKTLSAGGR
ncbi:MAG: pilus assembly protein CpaD [Sphingobium sp.]|nr:pilus assembly protein CpaD [Sphingobium sp.]